MNTTVYTVFWTLTAVAVIFIILRMKKKGMFGKEEPPVNPNELTKKE